MELQFVDARRDPWRTVGGDDGPHVSIPPAAHRLLDLAQWRAARATWPADLPVGVIVPNDVDIESLEDDLPRLALIALQFPKWTDGRAYSQARLLRVRLGFRGELRATGEVLADMVPLLARTGFDAIALRADQSEDVARRALSFFPGHYQADVRDPRPLFAKPAAAVAALVRAPEFTAEGEGI
jgi:uncharacterized protein (DUF934 family)